MGNYFTHYHNFYHNTVIGHLSYFYPDFVAILEQKQEWETYYIQLGDELHVRTRELYQDLSYSSKSLNNDAHSIMMHRLDVLHEARWQAMCEILFVKHPIPASRQAMSKGGSSHA